MKFLRVLSGILMMLGHLYLFWAWIVFWIVTSGGLGGILYAVFLAPLYIVGPFVYWYMYPDRPPEMVILLAITVGFSILYAWLTDRAEKRQQQLSV